MALVGVWRVKMRLLDSRNSTRQWEIKRLQIDELRGSAGFCLLESTWSSTDSRNRWHMRGFSPSRRRRSAPPGSTKLPEETALRLFGCICEGGLKRSTYSLYRMIGMYFVRLRYAPYIVTQCFWVTVSWMTIITANPNR